MKNKITAIILAQLACAAAWAQIPEDLLKKAEAGDAEAMFECGQIYEYGEDTEPDLGKAFEFYQKAANKGDAWAVFSLGRFYDKGIFVERNEKKAAELFMKAADKGHAIAMFVLGLKADKAGDSKKAVEWYRKAATLGDTDAQYNLGWAYATGSGVKADQNEAFKWYKTAADNGDAESMSAVCKRLLHGKGTEKNEAEAFAYCQKSAEAGHEPAFYDMGLFFEKGIGTISNHEKAFEWFVKSAEAGDPYGLNAVGNAYFSGRGVAKDRRKAVEFWTKASEKNPEMPHTLHNLGYCHAEGIGVKKNLEKAKKYFRRAAALGEEKSLEQLDKIEAGGDVKDFEFSHKRRYADKSEGYSYRWFSPYAYADEYHYAPSGAPAETEYENAVAEIRQTVNNGGYKYAKEISKNKTGIGGREFFHGAYEVETAAGEIREIHIYAAKSGGEILKYRIMFFGKPSNTQRTKAPEFVAERMGKLKQSGH